MGTIIYTSVFFTALFLGVGFYSAKNAEQDDYTFLLWCALATLSTAVALVTYISSFFMDG